MCKIKLIVGLLYLSCTIVSCDLSNNEIEQCNLPKKIKDEIASYAPVVEKIINKTIYGEYKGTTYKHLANFVDKFGNRIAGSLNLEKAIDYMLHKSIESKLENVHGEEVQVPHWVRGNESATLLAPRHQPLAMLGLGSSIGTPPEGIRAEALIVTSFDELKNISNKAKGKIVVFDQEYVNYGVSVEYRDYAATRAASYGAVATLVRSITPFSLNTPHTGWQDYSDNITKIPTACITVEDANMLRRIQERGEKIIIEIKMEAQNLSPATSRNSVAEIVGHSQPEKVVIVSGHLDSWDVGQGAMDDGGGAFLSWNSAVILKALGLRARRTLRAILWTAEEEGLVGAFAYVKAHKNETKNLNFVMESDEGTFTPHGLKFSGVPDVGCILQEILNLFSSINATHLQQPADGAPDLTEWLQEGIPGASLLNEAERYFWFHHSAADTMDVENPEALDKATALWAAVAYIIADLSFDMPRNSTDFLHNDENEKCNLSEEIKDEIASYAPVTIEIINKIVYGKYKGTTYEHLVRLTDKFGSRSVGSPNLENAIDYMLNKSNDYNLENVHGEKVELPHWVRENESATLLKPLYQPLAMLGLGNSVGTPSDGIHAEVLVVNSFDELEKISSLAYKKIVVFNQEYTEYSETGKYRMFGASVASGYGAVAALIRSVTPFSLNTPHTGIQVYKTNVTKIPAACITMEDAIMLRRMQEQGEKIIIQLKMEAKFLKPVTSRNSISEIVGSDQPEKVVVISGHLDTWDVAKGAMDDGGGSIVSWNTLVILKELGLRPKRTIRTILWTGEEIGLLGAFAYTEAHKNETKNLNLVMESDGGTFTPLGLKYTGLPEVGCILQEVLKLLSPINATQLTRPADYGPDLNVWLLEGVPGANLFTDMERYFWFHHSSADTMMVEDSAALDKATAVWATVAYVIANLSIDLPKTLTDVTVSGDDYDILLK